MLGQDSHDFAALHEPSIGCAGRAWKRRAAALRRRSLICTPAASRQLVYAGRQHAPAPTQERARRAGARRPQRPSGKPAPHGPALPRARRRLRRRMPAPAARRARTAPPAGRPDDRRARRGAGRPRLRTRHARAWQPARPGLQRRVEGALRGRPGDRHDAHERKALVGSSTWQARPRPSGLAQRAESPLAPHVAGPVPEVTTSLGLRLGGLRGQRHLRVHVKAEDWTVVTPDDPPLRQARRAGTPATSSPAPQRARRWHARRCCR